MSWLRWLLPGVLPVEVVIAVVLKLEVEIPVVVLVTTNETQGQAWSKRASCRKTSVSLVILPVWKESCKNPSHKSNTDGGDDDDDDAADAADDEDDC